MLENNPFIHRLQHNAIGNFNQQLREDASVVTHAASPRAFLGGSAGAVTLPHNGRVIRGPLRYSYVYPHKFDTHKDFFYPSILINESLRFPQIQGEENRD